MNPARGLYDLLYGSRSVEFKSAFGMQESVDRLRASTRRSVFSALAQQAAVGPVKETRVSLQRVIPMVGNSFKPFFIGRFEMRDGAVYLTGRFTMLALVKVFMTIWLGMAGFFGVAVLTTNRAGSITWPGALGAFAMTGLGLAFVWVGKWFARNDVEWLSNVIRGALESPIAGRSLSVAPYGDGTVGVNSGTPTVLRVVAGVLAVMGLVSLFATMFGTESAQGISNGIITRYFPMWPPRMLAVINAAILLGLALGVYQRKLLAWRLVLFYLGAALGLSVIQMLTDNSAPMPTSIRIVFPVLSFIVAGIWIRWWYAQRIHFDAATPAWPKSGT